MNQEYEAKFKVGDKIRLYGKETTIRGFYISYNDALNKYETIMLTDGRGDPFERSLDAIEYLDESINQEDSLKDSDELESRKYFPLDERLKKIDWIADSVDLEYCAKYDRALQLAEARIEELENVIAPLLQNKTSNSEATILSAEQILDKWFLNDPMYSQENLDKFKTFTVYKRTLSAMEEYHNQFK